MKKEGNYFVERLPGNRLKVYFIISMAVLLLIIWICSAIGFFVTPDIFSKGFYLALFAFLTLILHGHLKNINSVSVTSTGGIKIEEKKG